MKTRKKHSKLPFLAIPAILLLSGGIAYFYAQSSSSQNYLYEENAARLKALETTDLTQIQKQLKSMNQSSGLTASIDISSITSNPDSLLDNIQIKQAFQGNVILGDSITESIVEYGFLDTDVVISQRGLSISNADSHIQTAISLHPANIFMAFGSNDLEIFVNDAASFIAAYQTQIDKLKSALPEVPIYINAILPLTPAAISSTPSLGAYPQFNEALIQFCEYNGCTYLDTSFLVENNPQIYEPDGQHVVMSFYPMWLTFMAKSAGL